MRHRSPVVKANGGLTWGTVFVSFAVLVVALIAGGMTSAEAWMTYRHDSARSGVTADRLTPPLSLHWTFKPTHAPRAAWPMPSEEIPRMHFDSAYHVTISKGTVYFGGSVDNKVYALNATTGKVRWTFFTEGPVRFAPTVWNNRVYVGSDDGFVYCLRARNGKLVWKYRAGPSDEKVLGNGRMISLWPVRTSVLVDDGVVYFGAGVFPYEGIYICALDARDGTVIWKNDTTGDRQYDLAFGGISPQSYLIASENILYVPSGRAMPAAFDRNSGKFLYYCSPGSKVGGTWALLDRGELIAGVDRSGTPAKVAYDGQTGKRKGDAYAWFPGIDLVVTPDVAYALTQSGISAIDRTEYPAVNSKLSAVRKEQQELGSMLSDLRRKIRAADEATRDELDKQVDEITTKINGLAKEEESNLKSFACKWEYSGKNLCSLILAGDVVFAGGDGVVVAIDAKTGKELWKEKLEGKAYGLAASKGSLLVSTDKGPIYCFGEGKKSGAPVVEADRVSSPYPEDKLTPVYKAAAKAIFAETGIEKGCCLVLGCGTGRLAFELAKLTELQIIGIEEDPEKVEAAKQNLDAAGLYGSGVVVERWDLASLPDYFANLIVSDEMTVSGRLEDSSSEMFRVLRPYGGIAYFGQPAEASNVAESLDLENLLRRLRSSGGPQPKVARRNGVWAKVTRGELEGAGSWTELYGNPQNTACSDDLLVKCPLGVLWFGDPGPKGMVERHARVTSPVSINGRLFVQGEEVIMAYDAYNGTFLWKREIPGAVRVRADVDGGNLALTEEALYVAAHDKCYRLDPATGETVRVYEIPSSPDGSPRRWGYISCVGKILYGSTAMPLRTEYAAVWKMLVDDGKWRSVDEIPSQYRYSRRSYLPALMSRYPEPDERVWKDFQRSGALWRWTGNHPSWGSQRTPKDAVTDRMMVGDLIFAMDTKTGELLWTYRGDRIANITPTIGDGVIFFADNSATEQQKARALEEKQNLIQRRIYEEGDEASLGPEDVDVRLVVALDAVTGEKLWEKPLDLTGCGGDKMGGVYQDGVLLFFGSFSNHDGGLFREGALKFRRITALSAGTGEVLWSRPLNYLRRPLVVGDKIIIEPRSCDLHTGEITMRSHPITGEQVPWEFLRPGHSCSITSAAPNLLSYRSYNVAFYDLVEDRGITYFGGIRPGCWINLIPASGLMLFPEASAGCTCSFPLRCSVALTHKQRKRPRAWTVFITHGDMTPVRHFAVNLGAPGDMKDDEGTLWFGYPRPQVGYGVKFHLTAEVLPGMSLFCRDFKDAHVEGSDRPWLFTSGYLGFSRCEVPLIDKTWEEQSAVYTIRLGFMALSGDRVGRRVFDVNLQGDTVLKDFDILAEAGVLNKAVIKEFKGIKVENGLKVELVPKTPNPDISRAPLINFIEAIREDAGKISAAPESAQSPFK